MHTQTHRCTYIFFFLVKITAKFCFPVFSVSDKETYFSVLVLIPYKQWCIEMQLPWQLFHKLKANPYQSTCWVPCSADRSRFQVLVLCFCFFLTFLTQRIHFSIDKRGFLFGYLFLIKVSSRLLFIFKIL